MYGETEIPVREALPEYPDSYHGQKLIGIDACHYGHYWRGDRIEIVEKRRTLRTDDGDATLAEAFVTKGEVPMHRVEGGPVEYARNVGAYLDRFVDGPADPVYADDRSRWEWVSAYGKRWAAPRENARSGAADARSSADALYSG